MGPMLGPSTSAYGNPPVINPLRRHWPENNKSFSGQGLYLKHTHLFLWLVHHHLSFPHAYRSFLFFFLLFPRAGLSSPTVLDAVYLYLNLQDRRTSYSLFFKHPLEECLPLVRVARCSLYYADSSSSLDVFYGLTAVRVLSIIALLLAFSSSIVALVSDVRAVNRSQHDAHSSDGTCGYIGFACSLR
jgi:hypothetical protein